MRGAISIAAFAHSNGKIALAVVLENELKN